MCHAYTSRYSFTSLSYESPNVKKMHPQLTLAMHFIFYLIFSLVIFYIYRRNIFNSRSCKTSAVCYLSQFRFIQGLLKIIQALSDNNLRFITKSFSLHFRSVSGTIFISLRVLPGYSSYNLSTEAVLSLSIPTAYLIIPSITIRPLIIKMIFYWMFLYTSFEILLYVVSIFNTSANVGSFDFYPNFKLSDLSLPF